MSKPSKLRSSESIQADISAAGNTARNLRRIYHGTLEQAAILESLIVGQVSSFPSYNDDLDSPQNARGAHVYGGDKLTEAVAVRGLVAILASDPCTAEALRILDPLFAELEAAEAAEAKEKQLADQLEASRLENLAKAKEAALAEVESRFAIA